MFFIIILPGAALILSTALLTFYLKVTCERILRREFDQPYFQMIVQANRLEFAELRKELETGEKPEDYPHLWLALRCDFLILHCLLRSTSGKQPRNVVEEHLLVLYSYALFLCWKLLHALRLGERPVILKLAEVFQYFANELGRRVEVIRLGKLSPSSPSY